jgi:hypothetical protein
MRTRYVCTEPTTYGRIVSLNPKALSATTSSRRIRGDKNHFIFAVGTKHHLCARNLQDSKMFTLHSQTVDLMLINLFYSLTAGSSFRIRATFHVEKSLGSSAKTHKSQTSLLCDARSHKSHLKSLNVNGFFCATSSHQRRNTSNSKNSQNEKSLNVTDSEACLRLSRSRPVLRALRVFRGEPFFQSAPQFATRTSNWGNKFEA